MATHQIESRFVRRSASKDRLLATPGTEATMIQDQTTQPAIYCRGCGYRLLGLSECRCPECGRPFDANDARTFHRGARQLGMRRWLRRIALLMVMLTLFMSGGLGWLYWQWRAEQAVLASLPTNTLSWQERTGPVWLRHMMGPRLAFLLDRTCEVRVFPGDGRLVEVGAAQMSLLSRLSCLRRLWLSYTKVSDDGLEYLPALPRLEVLVLSPDQVCERYLRTLRRTKVLREIIIDTGNDRGYWSGLLLDGLPNVKVSAHLMTP